MNFFRAHTPLWILLTLLAAGHLPLMVSVPLTSDEGLYWEWSRHLALGYYTHPPMVGWAIAAVTRLLGTSLFSVRLTALLFHLGTVALLYGMVRELSGGWRLPTLAGLFFGLMPVSLVLGTMIVTDGPLIFFWTAAAWLTKRAVIDGRRRHWYGAGVAAGAMMLCKFFAVLFFPALLLFLLAHRAYRGELLRPQPWLAALIALIVFSPFLYWNATHQWLTFQFNLLNRQASTGFDPVKPALYVLGQALAASPVVLVALVIALAAALLAAWRRLRNTRPAWAPDEATTAPLSDAVLFYTVLTVVPLLILGWVSLSARIGAHWTAYLMPTGCLVLVLWLSGSREQPARDFARPGWLWACTVGLLLTTLPLAVLLLYPRLLPDRYVTYDEARERTPAAAKFWGWPEVGRRIDALRAEYESLPGGLFFSTRDYSDASLFGFNSPAHEPFVLMGYRAEEFHGKEFLYWDDAVKRPGANTIFVMDGPIFPDNLQRIEPYFREVKPLDTLVVRDANGIVLRKFYFALGLDYQNNEPDVLSRW